MPNLEVFTMRGSPPSYAVTALLKEMEIPFKATVLSYFGGDQFKPEHVKRNPQREVPVLKDGDYHLSESIAILQYVCEEYGKNHPNLYPKDPKQRGIVNHRLAFSLGKFYPNVGTYTFAEIYGDPNSDQVKAKAERSLFVLETLLKIQNTKFAAGECFTIADISMLGTAICMEASNFDFSPYPFIAKWYEMCKKHHPSSWEEFKVCRDDLSHIYNNPPKKEQLVKLDKMRNESFKN